MLLKRFYDETLAQASYLIGCSATGESLVVDANRHVDAYLDAATAEGLRVTHVTETHIHADFVSGSRELAQRAGAKLLLSAEGGEDWQYRFAEHDGATLIRGGDAFMIGNVRVDVVHTPGHTPEHLTFLITDTAGATEPMGAVTGDFLFVGDVGRPDLLERAAKVAGTMEDSARALYRSLAAFRVLPDYLQIWPGHGAGSACGKALGAVPQSTLGYERRFNWAFSVENEAEFVRRVLAGQPAPPTYFAQMKRINRDGPSPLAGREAPALLDAAGVRDAVSRGQVAIDVRAAERYASRHVVGTVNIPLNRSFTTWAGWLVPYETDLVIVASDEESARGAAHDLALIGLDRIRGIMPEVMMERDGAELSALTELTGTELHDALRRQEVVPLDVRTPAEYRAGHVPGAPNIPLGELPDRIAEVPNGKPLVVTCQTGARSSIAASLLEARGVRRVQNHAGGFAEWRRLGLPVER